MSQIRGTLTNIRHNSMLHLLEFELKGQSVTLLTLELHRTMTLGESYELCVKSTDIALAKDFSGTLSILNQLQATVVSIDCQELLCSVVLDIDGFSVESIILKSSAKVMDLSIGDSVFALIKASEVSIC
ncbi:MAG TPA: hypothetical protein ENK74_07830 [Nitratifractor sp.]|nr:hypothetical protein [Nitratifractor sp.]